MLQGAHNKALFPSPSANWEEKLLIILPSVGKLVLGDQPFPDDMDNAVNPPQSCWMHQPLPTSVKLHTGARLEQSVSAFEGKDH